MSTMASLPTSPTSLLSPGRCATAYSPPHRVSENIETTVAFEDDIFEFFHEEIEGPKFGGLGIKVGGTAVAYLVVGGDRTGGGEVPNRVHVVVRKSRPTIQDEKRAMRQNRSRWRVSDVLGLILREPW